MRWIAIIRRNALISTLSNPGRPKVWFFCFLPPVFIVCILISLLNYIDHDDIIKWKTSSALLALCAGNSPVTGEFPTQRPVTRGFDASFDLRLDSRLSKHSWDWWFVKQSCSLWCHCNAIKKPVQFQCDCTIILYERFFLNISLVTTVIFTVMGIVEMYHLYVIILYALLEVVLKTLQYKHHHTVRAMGVAYWSRKHTI